VVWFERPRPHRRSSWAYETAIWPPASDAGRSSRRNRRPLPAARRFAARWSLAIWRGRGFRPPARAALIRHRSMSREFRRRHIREISNRRTIEWMNSLGLSRRDQAMNDVDILGNSRTIRAAAAVVFRVRPVVCLRSLSDSSKRRAGMTMSIAARRLMLTAALAALYWNRSAVGLC